MTVRPLNFGAFITPFHPVGQSPTTALEYDLERTVRRTGWATTRCGSANTIPAVTN